MTPFPLGPNGTGAKATTVATRNSGKTSNIRQRKAYAAAQAGIFKEPPSTSATPRAEHAAVSSLPSSSTTTSYRPERYSRAGTDRRIRHPAFPNSRRRRWSWAPFVVPDGTGRSRPVLQLLKRIPSRQGQFVRANHPLAYCSFARLLFCKT
jgi:hypothetical protein